MNRNKSKNKVRREYLDRRSNLSSCEVASLSSEIEKRLFSLDIWEKSSSIFVYVDFNNEVITRNIILEGLKSRKEVCVPICNASDYSMEFYKISSLEELSLSFYGILEPSPVKENLCMPTENSLIIIPLVAFNEERQRIGYGKGFYDRYFSRFNLGYKIGLAYSFQKLCGSQNFFDEFDVPLDCILTEKSDNSYI